MVSWSYYDKPEFEKINKMYLPPMGEGTTMASQAVTAVNKLVYKWYNDGDVFDNTHGMDGWCNDLSSYANWLYYHVFGADKILDRIYDCYSDDDYEDLLKELADHVCDEKLLFSLEKLPVSGSIYDEDGPYEFRLNEDEDEDEY